MAAESACEEGTAVRERRGTTTRLPMIPQSTSGRAVAGMDGSGAMRLRFDEARTVSSNSTCKSYPLYPTSMLSTMYIKFSCHKVRDTSQG